MIRAMVVINFNGALGANSRRSMLAACARWGVQFWEITEKTHRSIHSPASMKTLVFTPGVIDPDEAFILDADTVIRSDAPSPFEVFPQDCLTVVENGGPRFGDWGEIKECERHEWVKVLDFLPDIRGPYCRAAMPYFNSGMMLARRSLHRPVFHAAEHICRQNLGLGWQDQTPLNFVAALEFGQGRINVHFADETWNYIHPELLPDWRVMQKYIYHFAGSHNRAETLESIRWEI